MATAAFDRVAEQYDALWTNSAIGRHQREAVWRWIDALFQPGDSILDLGCGTGEDAAHLMHAGIAVKGLDSSAGMVRVANARGVNAQQLAFEHLSRLTGSYDGAISNFGALNCVEALEPVAESLSRLLRPGAHLAICLMGPLCLWEIFHFAARFRFEKALRRWRSEPAACSLGIGITYPSVKRIVRAFRGAFQLTRWCGIGLCVPPSYVGGLSDAAIARLAGIDQRITHWPLLRAFADHRLLLFTRL